MFEDGLHGGVFRFARRQAKASFVERYLVVPITTQVDGIS